MQDASVTRCDASVASEERCHLCLQTERCHLSPLSVCLVHATDTSEEVRVCDTSEEVRVCGCERYTRGARSDL